ncbi:MAG: hypothetical protein QG588_102 [Candidatus Poribacteria bacterium]|nr:hypothetical protein [Candidatus Poribacteria bacterium]
MKIKIAILFVLISIIVLFFFRSFDNYFLSDDFTFVKEFKLDKFSDLNRIFAPEYPVKTWKEIDYNYGIKSGYGFYRPTLNLVFAISTQLFGYNAGAYRVVAFIVYLSYTILGFVLIYLVSKDFALAVLSSLILAVHPVRDIYLLFICTYGGMCFVFYLLAVILYIIYRSSHTNVTRYLSLCLSFLCAILGYFYYEVLITLPLAIILVEFFMAKLLNRWRLNLLNTIPYFVLAGLYFVIRWFVLHGLGNSPGVYDLSNVFELIKNFVKLNILMFVPNFNEFLQSVSTVIPRPLRHKIIGALFFFVLTICILFLVFFFKNKDIQSRIKDFAQRHNIYLKLIVFSILWVFIGMLPGIPYPVIRLLEVSVVGFSMLLAIFIVSLANFLKVRFRVHKFITYGVLVISIWTYYYSLISIHVNEYEMGDQITKGIVNGEILGNMTDKEGKVTVYFLNFVNAIGDCHLGVNGMSEALQIAYGKEDLRVKNPYLLNYPNVSAYKCSKSPKVKIISENTVVVDFDDNIYNVSFGHFNSAISKGFQLKNGDYYTLEILEVNEKGAPKKIKLSFNKVADTVFFYLFNNSEDRLEPFQWNESTG